MTIRVMVIDDHELFRLGLTQYFAIQPDIEVAAEAANGKELLEKLATTPVDILLLDMVMPGISGVERITNIKAIYPDLPVLIISARYDVETVLSAMSAGASGYISKSCQPQDLLDAVREVMVTGKYLSEDMANWVGHAAVATRAKNEEVINSGDAIRLDGKTISEWKEDCESFYQGMVYEGKVNDELTGKNTAPENEAFELNEKIRCAGQQEPSGSEPR